MNRCKNKGIVFITFGTPFGKTGLASTNGKLIRICSKVSSVGEFKDFLESQYLQRVRQNGAIFIDLIQQFDLYFKGLLKKFNYPLDISPGTNFQQKVWKSLKTLPYGEIRSYQWLAKSIGKPRAIRAVGNANGKNPLPIIIPCHRIINKDGQLGGYTGGIDIKIFLLNLEGSKHEPIQYTGYSTPYYKIIRK